MLDDWHIISSLSYLLFLSYYQLMSLYFRSFLAIIYLLYYISINLAFRIFNSILLYILLIYDLGFAYFISTYLLYPQIFNFIMPGPSPSLSTYSNNHAEPARSYTRICCSGRLQKYITEEEQDGQREAKRIQERLRQRRQRAPYPLFSAQCRSGIASPLTILALSYHPRFF